MAAAPLPRKTQDTRSAALESAEMLPDSELYARYLRLLGLEGIPSGLRGLQDIVRRHVHRVPFENVSKLLLHAREGAGRAFTLEEFLDGIEQYDLGGTCYTCNPYLTDLLRHLGYDADLLGADMTVPDIHTCVRVRIDGVPYLIDCGYGGPFREPLRLDRVPHVFFEGSIQYIFGPNAHPNAYEMKSLSGGQPVHGYIAHEPPRAAAFFEPAVRKSFTPGQTFMNHMRIVRIFDEHSVELFDRKLTIHRAGASLQTELSNLAEFQRAITVDLAMPRCPVEQALAAMERITGTPLFAAA
jgi:arylamine N-acetyltransferase